MPSAIRFVPVKYSQANEITRLNSTPCPEAVSTRGRSKAKSRSGCRECKTSRVKCDEAFPICTRCQRLGRICRLVSRKDHQEQWQIEVPGITISGSFAPWHKNDELFSMSHINKKLLWAWLKTTSRIMVLDNASNPLSFPILDYLSVSASLVHVLQSISAGHDQFFEQSKLEVSLQERSMALKSLQVELGAGLSMLCCFLTAYLLGISSTFLDKDVLDYGKEHLFAARHMLEALIADPTSHQHQMTNFCLGAFIYWDMTCSVLIDPDDQKVLDDGVISEYLSNMARGQHPITGPCTGIFLLLGHLGRYCRTALDTGIRSEALEHYFEQQLLQWDVFECEQDFWKITAEAYRNHGLIMLYRTRASITSGEKHLSNSKDETVIRDLSLKVLHGLSKIPIGSTFLVLQATPLMSAGAELGIEDEELRKEVILRFKALFSSNRLPVSLWAVTLLQELWEFRDLGITMSWLELMLAKNWRLRLG